MAAFIYKFADVLRLKTSLHVQAGIRGFCSDLKDYIYVDHAYFQRGGEFRNVRITRGWVHQVDVIDWHDDRLSTFGVKIEPWRNTGSYVLVIPPSGHQCTTFGVHDWLDETVSRIYGSTNRSVVVKEDKKSAFRPMLMNAWAVVTWSSVAGVEAALAGVPVFPTDLCPSWAVRSGSIEDIDNPIYPERYKWANGLAHSTWKQSELESLDLENYHHARSHDL